MGIMTYKEPKFATGALTDLLVRSCTANGYAIPQADVQSHIFNNARQVAAALRRSNDQVKRSTQASMYSTSFFFKGELPTEPNTYIDGGLLHPAQREWQLGTYGAWHIDRCFTTLSLSDFELANATLNFASGG